VANRIKLKGTTETAFDIAGTGFPMTPSKTMEAISLQPTYHATYGSVLNIDSFPSVSPIGASPAALWLAPRENTTFMVFGGGHGTTGVSTIQHAPGTFSLIGPLGSSATSNQGGSIYWSAGAAAAASNANGGQAVISGGNGEGTGNGGNLTIQAGSANGSGDVGNVAIQGNNIEWTILGELTVNLNPGITGQVLTSQGTGTPPIWAAPAFVAPKYEAAVATALQTVFNTTLTTTANTGGKTFLQVFVNGVKQMEGAAKAYTVTGANQITFNTGVTLNYDVEFYGYA